MHYRVDNLQRERLFILCFQEFRDTEHSAGLWGGLSCCFMSWQEPQSRETHTHRDRGREIKRDRPIHWYLIDPLTINWLMLLSQTTSKRLYPSTLLHWETHFYPSESGGTFSLQFEFKICVISYHIWHKECHTSYMNFRCWGRAVSSVMRGHSRRAVKRLVSSLR